jgi:hypothetical protein
MPGSHERDCLRMAVSTDMTVTAAKARLATWKLFSGVENDFESGDLWELFMKRCVKLRLDAGA